jgi:hypothetical protein
MPEDKSLGSKLLGLFVDTGNAAPEDEPPAEKEGEKSAAEVVAELAGQTMPQRPGPSGGQLPSPAGPVAPASVDFDAVFRNAGVDPTELDRVRKAEELLKSLPEATPKDVKRQIVEAALKAFGFEVPRIAQAASSQLKALDTWERLLEQQTAKAIAEAQGQIAQLEDKVISLRADITKRTEQRASMAAAADGRRAEVGKVLEFFQLDPSKP